MKMPQSNSLQSRFTNNFPLWLGLVAVITFFVVAGITSYVNTNILRRNAQSISHTYEVMLLLNDVLSLVKDAETGQRGYVITGDNRYLEPHAAAVSRVEERLNELQKLTLDNAVHQAQIPYLREQIGLKLKELEETIDLRRRLGFEPARDVIVTDRGKVVMDAIREQLRTMRGEELRMREERLGEMEDAFRAAVVAVVLTALLGIILTGVITSLVRRAMLVQASQEWLLRGQSGLGAAMVGDPNKEQLGERVLKFLSEYLNAQAGAFFVSENGVFRRTATYGAKTDAGTVEQFTTSDGLLGQAAKDGRSFVLSDVPDGYLSASSAFGKSKPRHLVVAPLKPDSETNGVLELGFFNPLDNLPLELLEKVSESIGISIRSANYRAYLHNLLEETQRQAEELQSQGEELRVSNEELEEQSQALKIIQSQLEQSNAQLEEHMQVLESQRDELALAQTDLRAKAQELARASQYKSEFLANMSHELRTPLNSALILAKLLADNSQGNLTSEQIQYAENISSAGNDLLNLINDILDLSKIEAGHMEVRLETVWLSRLVEDLDRVFQPMASQKGLKLVMQVALECPTTFKSDRQRLEQILKNLLSNAIKFTEHGQVKLSVRPLPGAMLEFAVMDTGIGIPKHQQELVFEAFQQAESTSVRRYGGTGLGLSISRELVKILGGSLHLESEPGQGSTFTVVIPQIFDPVLINERQGSVAPSSGVSGNPTSVLQDDSLSLVGTPTATSPGSSLDDDRAQLSGTRRVLLVIEDDEVFAKILYDLAHELNFECLIATTAEDGLRISLQQMPSAVVLDVGLPDHSGLTVLDRLKRDGRTRHIPVHVISASDYSHSALSMGAVGYLLKPVKREELAQALNQLESRLEKDVCRVLIVEDDPIQLDGLQKLLGSHQVETVGASSATECLRHLKEATFDCMVLDLSLPDASGYSLLETLSQENTYSFPPVIVYTGRDLSTDEEHRLRRYSQSIIIKGAKSPERLLDEVTLFLHQMVAKLPIEQQQMIELARNRDTTLEGRRILIVEDDVRNVFALTRILEPQGAAVQIARNGREALQVLEASLTPGREAIDLVLMDVMMPEMDGIAATKEIRQRPSWKNLPIIMLTAKAMKDDQEQCLAAGANDYMAKPLDVEKLLSLIRVWMPR